MRRPAALLVLAALALLGAALWLVSDTFRDEKRETLTGKKDAGVYTRYHGTDPVLPLSFDYPGGWRLLEDKGRLEPYTQVMVLGPRNVDDTYSCTLVVRGSPLRRKGGRFGSVEELVGHYESHLFEGHQVLERSDRSFFGRPAKDVTVQYTIPPLRHKGLVPKKVPVTVRTIFLEKDGYLYELIYSADSVDFPRYSYAFDRLIESFQFSKGSRWF